MALARLLVAVGRVQAPLSEVAGGVPPHLSILPAVDSIPRCGSWRSRVGIVGLGLSPRAGRRHRWRSERGTLRAVAGRHFEVRGRR